MNISAPSLTMIIFSIALVCNDSLSPPPLFLSLAISIFSPSLTSTVWPSSLSFWMTVFPPSLTTNISLVIIIFTFLQSRSLLSLFLSCPSLFLFLSLALWLSCFSLSPLVFPSPLSLSLSLSFSLTVFPPSLFMSAVILWLRLSISAKCTRQLGSTKVDLCMFRFTESGNINRKLIRRCLITAHLAYKFTYPYISEYIYIYIPYPRRIEFSSEWSNRVAISVYCKPLHIWIEVSVDVRRMYVNNSNCDS